MRAVWFPLFIVATALVVVPSASGASGTYVACTVGWEYDAAVKPRHCVFTPRGVDPELSSSQLPFLSANWKRWGRPEATGSGTVVGNMGFSEKATIRLSGLTECDGSRWYTRARLTFKDKAVQRTAKPRPIVLNRCGG
jgi:hypothetical protein